MRRAVKKQILEIMDTIYSTAEEIMAGKVTGNLLLDTLAQCQEGAIAVGTSIEESEGEGTEAVEKIEQFCEFLYHTAQEANKPERMRKLGKALRGKVIDIQNCIKNNVPANLEALFLPYKAAMWDSLESIWLAACEDPDCDPYVVPIPYYDKLPDGSFGNMHYELSEYPDNVPVVSYHTYSIADRKPDMIYIHNPYDEYNAVTSVPPQFFASNLREYTDMLVYVPYFLGVQDKVEAHFCVLPGTLYANKVIVESEAIRKIYIEEFKKYCRENHMDASESFIEDKFLALGSPKIDKVLSSKREDFVLPKEWEELIGDKKVILYNTHLNGLMGQGEKFLRKVKAVLDCFEQRTDVVLWWRPHPLSEATVQAMNPALLKEYEDIVEVYRKKAVGIFDDTPELHRAIAVSDAYYGDWSSLVTMYKETGKPIMIQNMDIVDMEDV